MNLRRQEPIGHPSDLIALEPEERIYVKIRRHWLYLLRRVTGVLVAGVVPLFLFSFLGGAGVFASLSANLGVNTLALSAYALFFWLTVVVLAFFHEWTDFYLDLWVVTNKRIIDVDQNGFFSRQVITTPLENIQDAFIEVSGLIDTFFNVGTIRIESASRDVSPPEIKGVYDPEGIKRIILSRFSPTTTRDLLTGETEDPLTHMPDQYRGFDPLKEE